MTSSLFNPRNYRLLPRNTESVQEPNLTCVWLFLPSCPDWGQKLHGEPVRDWPCVDSWWSYCVLCVVCWVLEFVKTKDVWRSVPLLVRTCQIASATKSLPFNVDQVWYSTKLLYLKINITATHHTYQINTLYFSFLSLQFQHNLTYVHIWCPSISMLQLC